MNDESGGSIPDSSFIILHLLLLAERGEGFDFIVGKYNMTGC